MRILSRPGVQKHRSKASSQLVRSQELYKQESYQWLHRSLHPRINFAVVDSWTCDGEYFAERIVIASIHFDAC